MQYTSKIALLAVALFGTSALAAPYAGDAEYDVEAREVDNELSAREFYDMYLEARADPSLDARDVESLDFEAREYLDYLEAREAATVAPPTPQTPQTPITPSTPKLQAHWHEITPGSEPIFLTDHQRAVQRAKKVAATKFQDIEFYHKALVDKTSQFHRFAVLKYLSKPKNLKKALANTDSRYHKAAKRVLHRHQAKVYLADKKSFKKALKNKLNKFHKDAVKRYLSLGSHFSEALNNEKAPYHRIAVHEYLLDSRTRYICIVDNTNKFHEQAVKLQKKINKHNLKHSKSTTATSSSVTSTPTAVKKA